jgi:hypothetical protein
MKTKYTFYISAVLISILFTSCGGAENFVDSTKITIWNNDTIPLDIYVNGEKSAEVDNFQGEIHLLAGDYEIVAKNGDEVYNTINISLDQQNEGNQYFHYVFSVGAERNYVLLNVGSLYDDDGDIEIEEKFFETDYMALKYNTNRLYWSWSRLPETIYVQEGFAPGVYQLFELPSGYHERSDAEILDYCKELLG